ncbi:MAG TPA: type III-A CRISPR-associated protein Cas10/Csm1 [Candidatus Obscuribacterales bacterium]
MEELPVVALGCLLHDIGKVIQRADVSPRSKSHSLFGESFLQEAGLIQGNKYWTWVLECVRNHHWKYIKEGTCSLPIAWFAYEADNLASAHDRKSATAILDSDGNRLEEVDISSDDLWDPKVRLQSIFSNFRALPGRDTKAVSLPLWFRRVEHEEYAREIYPYPSTPESLAGDTIESYQSLREILRPLVEHLRDSKADPTSLDVVNLVLRYLEEALSMVPPDTYRGHTNDVSLFDHLKLTAAIGSAMYAYVADAHPEWLSKPGTRMPWGREFRKEEAYILVKADMSGIQDFIYNISSKAALKGLRGRSFYLELLQSELADSLLRSVGLSRANLLYLGGGGFALLAPNTRTARETIDNVRSNFNRWLFELHKGRLFLGLEYAAISGDQIRAAQSEKETGMSAAWTEIGQKLSQAKSERFKDQLEMVFKVMPHVEECKICHRDDLKLEPVTFTGEDDLDICPICAQLIRLGRALPDASHGADRASRCELFVQDEPKNTGIIGTWNPQTSSIKSLRPEIAPAKGRGEGFVLHNLDPFRPPKLFWSLYEYKKNDFKQLAQASTGVERLAILRADVDNLGKVFSGKDPSIGLPKELRSLSRDAATSRALAKFFTHYLDDMLASKPQRAYSSDEWAITTVYAGGDDVFLVGAWNQVIDFALWLNERFRTYTCERLTISAGISIHKPGYPLYRMASDAHDAEQVAKKAGKDRLCVRFDDSILDSQARHVFPWNQWVSEIEPMVSVMVNLSDEDSVPSGFWSYLLKHVRGEHISFYQLLYNVARMEERIPKLKQSAKWHTFKKEHLIAPHNEDGSSRHTLETALNWLILLRREATDSQTERKEKEAAGIR